jgi:hypothetical protein
MGFLIRFFHSHALPDGASLFYTTTQQTTLNVLRQYALHVLFVPPAPAPDGALDGTAAPVRNPFPFVTKPNTLDRDRIVVPAGWDSWGKIGVLRDGTALTRKRGARHGSAIYCLTPESTRTSGTARESCTRPWCKTRAPKYALPSYHFLKRITHSRTCSRPRSHR